LILNIPLNEEAAVKKEYQAVKKEVDQIFTGLNAHKKYVFYFVANEVPVQGRVDEQYGFVDTLMVTTP
jgi:hypothetical protein